MTHPLIDGLLALCRVLRAYRYWRWCGLPRRKAREIAWWWL